ncbi:hypothetical protein, partial [Xanthomonas arboricola]|uniref:hypothetical protein n=1 Tax=Xanthomonas arboricola TaxID=56448 RepID=UPI001C612C60
MLVARSTGSGIHLLPKRWYLPKVPARVSFTMRVLQLRGARAERGVRRVGHSAGATVTTSSPLRMRMWSLLPMVKP